MLAERLPPEPARAGHTVLGEALPAAEEGEPQELKAGANTQLSEDGDRVVALADGHARLRDGAVCIEPVVIVQNVDYNTGNISFDGSVVVEGTVADGFRVQAGGSIQVDRYVGKAELTAGDSVLLRGGVNGGGECVVNSEADILARYIENARIRCRGNLFVEEAVMHSEVFAGGNAVLSGKRAEIFAGSCTVGGSIWCKKLGNVSEVKTFVRLGVDPAKVELASRLAQTIGEKQDELNELDARLRHTTEQIKSAAHITETQRSSLQELTEETRRRAEELRGLKKKHRRLESQMSPDRDALLVVEETVFHGVTLVFGNRDYPISLRGVRKTIFRMSDDEVTESGFNPYSPPSLTFKR